MTFKNDKCTLSTGREFYCFRGIIGMSDNYEVGDEVTYGFDGGFSIEDWTPQEKQELADYMINLWQKFKAVHDAKPL
jgi:hypothetical protein